MKVLIVGGGGREHAMAWKTVQSPEVEQVFVAPGNAGCSREPGVQNVDIHADDIAALVDFARRNDIGLTMVGPELPLTKGIVDAFAERELPCCGPSRAAAQLESSKQFAKQFMTRYRIPTMPYVSFTNPVAAIRYLSDCPLPIVIKADGLAAGKGVIVAREKHTALSAVRDMLVEGIFGPAGNRVLFEEFSPGYEISFTVLSDGECVLPLATSQDHKARDRGDRGPNTGGMGAHSPAPMVDQALHDRIMQEVIMPTVRGMKDSGLPYRGFLYAGLMIGDDGELHVLEFNSRLGDPEAQVILMRMQGDLVQISLAACRGQLEGCQLRWNEDAALGVVLAAGGYPNEVRSGDVVHIYPPAPEVANPVEDGAVRTKLFHAGTREQDGQIITAGGRVICVTGLGRDLADARQRVYGALKGVQFPEMFYRDDIGQKAMQQIGAA